MDMINISRRGKRVPEIRAGMQQGLSWIKPEMMQKVLSSIVRTHEQIKPAAVQSPVELMDLFPSEPQHEASVPQTDSRSVCVSESSQIKQSTTPMTIFYNGTVNVYHVSADKGEAIMELANNNSSRKTITQIQASSEMEEEMVKPSARLPIARKLSLQRFLEKRRDRLSTAAPYSAMSTSRTPFNVSESTSASVSAEDKDLEAHIRLSLSFPSQRSC